MLQEGWPPRGWDKSWGTDSPTLGFPCCLVSRGSFLSHSLSSSTRSIFSITWRAGHKGWAGLGALYLPIRGWRLGGPPLWHLPSPGAARSPPATSSSVACPGTSSAAQPVAAEPGARGVAPSHDHSSDSGGGGKGVWKEGVPGVTVVPSADSPTAVSPSFYASLPSARRHLSGQPPGSLPLCPPAPAHSNQLILQMLHFVPQLLHVQLTQQQFLLHGHCGGGGDGEEAGSGRGHLLAQHSWGQRQGLETGLESPIQGRTLLVSRSGHTWERLLATLTHSSEPGLRRAPRGSQ